MKKIISVMLVLCIFCAFAVPSFADDVSKAEKTEVSVFVDGNWHSVKALIATYDNNIYLSLRSLAEAFSSGPCAFGFAYDYNPSDGSFFTITTGAAYEHIEDSDPDEAGYLELKRNRIFVDGNEKRYYTFRYGKPEDLYISVLDVCFIFDIDASLIAKNAFWFKTGDSFSPDIASLDKDGYFDSVNCVLLGNALSGEVFFSKSIDRSYPIASISKLMTYLLVMEAVDDGRFSLDSAVTISANVDHLSQSENGLIKMEAGQISTVYELLNAMLVASSNEAAVALAEFTCGSESSFTTKMNRRARELGLSSAIFYNCDGLPIYSQAIFPVKRQNSMSGADLFRLVQYILDKYPSVTKITSQQFAHFPTFDYTTANSNPLVFNLDYVTGLKTGSTNLAGNCLVASDSSSNIVIVLGAEDNALRGRIAELLFRSINK